MDDTLHLVAEVIRVMTTEAVLRASRQACTEEALDVQICHIEKILPQLVSDRRARSALSKFLSASFLLFYSLRIMELLYFTCSNKNNVTNELLLIRC
jgi:hypothetical protein